MSYCNWQINGSPDEYILGRSAEPAPWSTLVFWGALRPGFGSPREQKQASNLAFFVVPHHHHPQETHRVYDTCVRLGFHRIEEGRGLWILKEIGK